MADIVKKLGPCGRRCQPGCEQAGHGNGQNRVPGAPDHESRRLYGSQQTHHLIVVAHDGRHACEFAGAWTPVEIVVFGDQFFRYQTAPPEVGYQKVLPAGF